MNYSIYETVDPVACDLARVSTHAYVRVLHTKTATSYRKGYVIIVASGRGIRFCIQARQLLSFALCVLYIKLPRALVEKDVVVRKPASKESSGQYLYLLLFQ